MLFVLITSTISPLDALSVPSFVIMSSAALIVYVTPSIGFLVSESTLLTVTFPIAFLSSYFTTNGCSNVEYSVTLNSNKLPFKYPFGASTSSK